MDEVIVMDESYPEPSKEERRAIRDRAVRCYEESHMTEPRADHRALSIEEISAEIKDKYSDSLKTLGAFENLEKELHQAYAAIAHNAAKVAEEFKRATAAEFRESQLINKLKQRDNGLKWIRSIAFTHWFGGAFEPRHMQAIMILAERIYQGDSLKDFDETNAIAQQLGDEWFAKFTEVFDD
jgi:hypothetical protein